MRIKTKVLQGTHYLREQCHLASEFKKEKNQPKRLQNFTTLCCFRDSKKASSTASRRFPLVYATCWGKDQKAKQARGQLSQTTYGAAPWPLVQVVSRVWELGHRPWWCLLFPQQPTWLGAIRQGSTKTSSVRGRGEETPGNQGGLETRETGDRASWPIFPTGLIWSFGQNRWILLKHFVFVRLVFFSKHCWDKENVRAEQEKRSPWAAVLL